MSQVITWPNSKKSPWTPDTIPICNPYITATVYLDNSPLSKHNGRDVIKCQCNNVYSTYDKSKYNYNFHLRYDINAKRWTKTLPSIKKGDKRVFVSGFYKGYLEESGKTYHVIRLCELDFEPAIKNSNNDNDDDLFFSSASKRSESTIKNFNDDDDDDDLVFTSKRSSVVPQKRHDSSDSSESSDSPLEKPKKKKKKAEKKSKATNKSTILKQELPYTELPIIQQLDADKSYTSTKQLPVQHNPYFNTPPQYYPYYYPPPADFSKNSFEDLQVPRNMRTSASLYSQKSESSDSKDKKIVQFNIPDEDKGLQQSDNDTIESNKQSPRGKRGKKQKNESSVPIRKSPRKRGGILNIATDKIIEIDDEEPQKSDSFMDTESDYQTQNEEDINDDGDASD